MARQAIERCESGFYHIVTREINRQNIFSTKITINVFWELLIVNRFDPLLKEHM